MWRTRPAIEPRLEAEVTVEKHETGQPNRKELGAPERTEGHLSQHYCEVYGW